MAFISASGASAISTPTSSQRLPLAFSKRFLERLEKQNPSPFTEFATEYPIMQKSGFKVIVTKTSALTINTTPLTETETKKESTFTTTNIALTLAFYGNDIGWSTLFDLTSVDIAKETHSRELAMNACETVTQVMVDQLDAEAVTGNTALTFARVVGAAKTLQNNKTRGFDQLSGHFVGAIGPYAWEDLTIEQNAAYKDHYQTPSGSSVMADGQLAKPAARFQFFISNFNKGSATTLESEYFWGDGALVKTELKSSPAGADGRAIAPEVHIGSLVGYLIPAKAELADPYGLANHAVWRGGPLAMAVGDSNRIVVLGVTTL